MSLLRTPEYYGVPNGQVHSGACTTTGSCYKAHASSYRLPQELPGTYKDLQEYIARHWRYEPSPQNRRLGYERHPSIHLQRVCEVGQEPTGENKNCRTSCGGLPKGDIQRKKDISSIPALEGRCLMTPRRLHNHHTLPPGVRVMNGARTTALREVLFARLCRRAE